MCSCEARFRRGERSPSILKYNNEKVVSAVKMYTQYQLNFAVKLPTVKLIYPKEKWIDTIASHLTFLHIHCVPKKRSHFYFFNNSAVDVKFSQDLTHQKSLKSVDCWQSYLKNKNVSVFLGHSVYNLSVELRTENGLWCVNLVLCYIFWFLVSMVKQSSSLLLIVSVNWFRCVYPFEGERCSRKTEDIDAFEVLGMHCVCT